jgi:hypothetical protein
MSYRWVFALLGTLFVMSSPALRAQERPVRPDSLDTPERRATRWRRGAGVGAGTWAVTGLTEVSGATYSVTPAFEGYMRRGLDRHVVLETGVGVWRRSQRASSASGEETVDTYVIPMTTAVRLFPFSDPDDRLQPFAALGAGFTIGVDDRNTVAGGLLGGGSGGGTQLLLGFAAKGGTGLELRLGSAFGLNAGVGYQWVRFFTEVGNERTFKGLQAMGGLTYRFQY